MAVRYCVWVLQKARFVKKEEFQSNSFNKKALSYSVVRENMRLREGAATSNQRLCGP